MRGEKNMVKNSRARLFYSLFLPLAVALNLGLGVVILGELHPTGWLGDLEMATGAFCCAVAGWLSAAAWSRSYWAGAMARQIGAVHQMVDTIFEWMEDSPPPADALLRLEGSLDDVLKRQQSTSS